MNGLKILYRMYQGAMAVAQRVLPQKKQSLNVGSGSYLAAAVILEQQGVKKVQIVTTAGTVRRGTIAPLLDALKQEGVEASVYDGVKPDPDTQCIAGAAESYREEGCDAFLAIGGGSVLDCTKMAAACAARPGKPIEKMAGTLKARAMPPFTVAIPTTAGTGSEVTAAAVVTDEKRGVKFPVTDLCLVPDAAILDPSLTLDLPKDITANTGMDAFTIHRLLEYTGGDNAPRFQRDQDHPLDYAAVIVVETSMVDVFLLMRLLRAIRPESRLILIGDADQLPSVGPGNIL